MKTHFSLFLILLFFCISLRAADNYSVGDTLFVWASSGLNLRSGPGTNFSTIKNLSFGERIIVEKKTEKTFNVVGIEKTTPNYYGRNSNPESVIFYGNWVEVILDSGEKGFVIDQYLLGIVPELGHVNSRDILSIATISLDTILKDPHYYSDSFTGYRINKVYNYGIKGYIINEGRGDWETYRFPNSWTKEEVLILLSNTLGDFKDLSIAKNWKDELVLVGSCSTLVIKNMEDGSVMIDWGGSC